MAKKQTITRSQAESALNRLSGMSGEVPLTPEKFILDNIGQIQAAMARHVTLTSISEAMAIDGIKISPAQLKRLIGQNNKPSLLAKKKKAAVAPVPTVTA